MALLSGPNLALCKGEITLVLKWPLWPMDLDTSVKE